VIPVERKLSRSSSGVVGCDDWSGCLLRWMGGGGGCCGWLYIIVDETCCCCCWVVIIVGAGFT